MIIVQTQGPCNVTNRIIDVQIVVSTNPKRDIIYFITPVVLCTLGNIALLSQTTALRDKHRLASVLKTLYQVADEHPQVLV